MHPRFTRAVHVLVACLCFALVAGASHAQDTTWFEDALPPGASVGGDVEGWTWVAANPSPRSGAAAHQSAAVAGVHQHYFWGASTPFAINAGESLYSYVYLDALDPPSEVMLQWNDGTWEHRAYWGANQINWGIDSTASRAYMGPLPNAGQWVRLQVPASFVGLEGRSLNGMAFTLYGGRATFDQAGKTASAGDRVWIDDAVPPGAVIAADAETWTWVTTNPTPFAGAVAHQSALVAGIHQHYFYNALGTMRVAPGESVFAYVFLDPSNVPSELMLQWDDGTFEHRAYWGANLILLGVDGTSSRHYMGPMPAAAQWVRLVVPANVVGLEGSVLNGMAFTLYGGRATFDYAGVTAGAGMQSQTIAFIAIANAALGAPPFNVSASASSGLAVSFTSLTPAICTVNGVTVSVLALGTCTIRATQPGNATYAPAPNVDQSFTVTANASTIVWFDDALPAGAVPAGDSEGWTWIGSAPAPYSGAAAHQSAVVTGVHQHYFFNASATLGVAPGESLFAYVYIDPLNQPTELMLQWNDGTWEHRAYWGANQIAWGVDGTGSRHYMGALPAAGQWVQLVVPAIVVGLEGSVLNGMAFTLYGGRATFDYAGKSAPGALQAQTITFPALQARTYGASPFALSASASSGLPVSFSSITASVCSISGNTVTILAAGTCTIRASQAGNTTYSAATTVDQTFTVARAPQSIVFNALPARALTSSPFNVAAIASSGLPVAFSSQSSAICTVSGVSVQLIGVGTCTLRASQVGDSNYASAPNVDQSFGVTGGQVAQAITFYAVADQFAGAAPTRLWASASSGLPVTFSSMTPAICSVTADQLTSLAAGACMVRSSQSGDAGHAPAANVDRALEVLMVNSGALFGRPVNYVSGVAPQGMVLADFNGDNRLDIATVNWSDGTVSVMLGQGDGTFAPAAAYRVGVGPLAIVAGDFNGDGKRDLAVVNVLSQDISVLLGQGDGTFAPALTRALGVPLVNVAAADIDGDGKLDLLLVNGSSNGVTGQAVYVLPGTGDGTFGSPRVLTTDIDPRAVVVADFNADGKLDVASVNRGSNTVSVFLGNGNGTFVAPTSYPVGYAPQAIAVADLNGDGALDIVTADAGYTVSVLLAKANGTFSARTAYPLPDVPGAISIGDFDADGALDVAVAFPLADSIGILLGRGDGTLQASASYGVLSYPVGLASGDLNGDGRIDLAVAAMQSDAVSVLLHVGATPAPGSIAINSGNGQSAPVNGVYATSLSVIVRDSGGQLVNGAPVTFTAPASGASGSFASGLRSVIVSTSATGVATAPTFTANASAGTFTVLGTTGALSASFNLTNVAANVPPAFTSAPPSNGTFNLPYSFAVTASGVPTPTFSVAANALPPGVALSPTSGLLAGLPIAAGTFAGMLTASNGVAPNASQAFAITIAQAAQTIVFNAIGDRAVDAAPFAVTASASSGLPVSVTSETTGVCAVNGNTVTVLAGGTCTLRADQAGSLNYTAAAPVRQSFAVTATPLVVQPAAFNYAVSGNELTMTGSVQAPLNSGLMVGNTEAMIDSNGQFFVDHVPVDATTGTVTLTLKSLDGRTVTRNVQVTATGAPTPVVLTGTPSRGVPPLDVTFRIQNNTGATISKIEIDFFGNGTYVDVGARFTQQGHVQADYPVAGTYHPVVRLTDAAGKTYAQSTTIVVDRPGDWDQVFRAMWQSLNNALVGGNSQAALANVTMAASARYGRVFTDLAGQFGPIVASYGPLILVEISGTYATYAVTRTTNGVQRVFLVDFLKDEDGIWRIDSM